MHDLVRAAALGLALVFTTPAIAAAAPAEGRYTSSGEGPVNSWWVETPHGQLILFDAQRDTSNANQLIAALQATGKPVAAIFVTHPHPDHVTGLGLVAAAFPQAAVYASAPTAAEIGGDTQGLLKLAADASPGALPPPHFTRVLRDNEAVAVDGIEVRALVLGDGESVGVAAFWLPKMKLLVSGDVATTGYVPWLAEARTREWLAQLDDLKSRVPSGARTLPGHGEPAGYAKLSGWMRGYLQAVRREVGAAQRPKSPEGVKVTEAERGAIAASLTKQFRTKGGVAGLPIERLWKLNIDAVARELTDGLKGYLPEK
ncbi:MAG: MBL fold metallo-hydrolase [Sphingomonas sp.]|uniref:MBL fold metallo-hydrolase n=1 Tax=Sphingomonas sp. TaxID=28214 RepID=UPI0025FAB7F5|nr:MBL fold metallo-hydrolase [Sphingomonas sp.]MBX9882200.1 MBL fold metallo-hydrolase [Sphingomonas sp.]